MPSDANKTPSSVKSAATAAASFLHLTVFLGAFCSAATPYLARFHGARREIITDGST
jgi:hypothetical protein